MIRINRWYAASLALFALAALPAWAQSAADQEAKDRAEIEKLMWNYARALDSHNAEAYAAAYTPDGEFVAGATAIKGHEALKQMIKGLREGGPALYHTTANSYLEFLDKDHARLHAYYITASAAAGQDTPARVVAVGREENELVRLNGKWLIKVRNVAPRD
jgi:uncharacterized protein (TIGR02246 family)